MEERSRKKLLKLSTNEKIEFIGDLWGSIEAEIALSREQHVELDQRLKEYRAGNVKWVSADQAEKEIRKRK